MCLVVLIFSIQLKLPDWKLQGAMDMDLTEHWHGLEEHSCHPAGTSQCHWVAGLTALLGALDLTCKLCLTKECSLLHLLSGLLLEALKLVTALYWRGSTGHCFYLFL